MKAEYEAEHIPFVPIPKLLKGIEPMLPMPADELAKESVASIRDRLSRLVRLRTWRADALMPTHPEEANTIRRDNIKIAAVRQELKDYAYVAFSLISLTLQRCQE